MYCTFITFIYNTYIITIPIRCIREGKGATDIYVNLQESQNKKTVVITGIALILFYKCNYCVNILIFITFV